MSMPAAPLVRFRWQTPLIIILGGCMIGLLGFGPRSGLGFFLTPMSAQYGWGRDVFSLALGLQMLLWGAAQPFMGAIADRYGPVPVLSAGLFIFYDIIRLLREGDVGFRWIVFPEALLIMPGTLIIVAAFASILGMHMSLRCRTTVRAVMSSVGIMLGACGALGWCGYQFLSSGRGSDNAFMLALSSFSPFTVLMLMIDPWETAGRAFNPANPADIASPKLSPTRSRAK